MIKVKSIVSLNYIFALQIETFHQYDDYKKQSKNYKSCMSIHYHLTTYTT